MTISLSDYFGNEGIKQISLEELVDLNKKGMGDAVEQRLTQIEKLICSRSGDLVPLEREMYNLIYGCNLFGNVDCFRASDVKVILPYLDKSVKGREKVLDVGSGTGLKTVYLALNNPGTYFVALDVQAIALSELEKRAKKYGCKNIGIVQGDLLAAPFSKAFDMVLVSNMIHESACVERDYEYNDFNMGNKFQNMIRILRPGGKLLISHANCSGFADVYAREMDYNMEKQGLSDIKTELLYSGESKILEIFGVKNGQRLL